MPKFIQICSNKYHLWALDDAGRVWRWQEWSRAVPGTDSPEWQTVTSWEPLTEHRDGFPGWPPTEQELAEAEVDALLK